MFFDDLTVGLRRDLGSYTFTRENIVAFAEKFDPQPFHLDEDAGRASILGGLAASGWHIGSACMSLLVADNRRRIEEAIARGEKPAIWGPSPGFKELRWLKPVLAGDVVTYSNVIEALRPSASRPEWGLVNARTTGVNQHGEAVYSFLATGFAPRRPPGS
jgi:acyl dehydratase